MVSLEFFIDVILPMAI